MFLPCFSVIHPKKLSLIWIGQYPAPVTKNCSWCFQLVIHFGLTKWGIEAISLMVHTKCLNFEASPQKHVLCIDFVFACHHVYSCFQCHWLKMKCSDNGKMLAQMIESHKISTSMLLFKNSADSKAAGLLPCFHCVGLAAVGSSIQEIGHPCHDPYILELLSFSVDRATIECVQCDQCTILTVSVLSDEEVWLQCASWQLAMVRCLHCHRAQNNRGKYNRQTICHRLRHPLHYQVIYSLHTIMQRLCEAHWFLYKYSKISL